jgi:hypothetical protein
MLDQTQRPTLETWLRGLFRAPLEPYGDYFVHLATRVESSAPVSAKPECACLCP